MLTRRAFLIASALSATALPDLAQSVLDPARSQLADEVRTLVQAYMAKYQVPALSLSYGRGSRSLFTQAYGSADTKTHQPATTESLFRIASLSKPITSAAIFTLVQAGKLNLAGHVFGPDGILSGTPTRSPLLAQITVRHLLTHTSGGWGIDGKDPMFHSHDRDGNAFLRDTLQEYPLAHSPGTAYAYSNFGYFLLGRVIERVSGQTYGDYVQQHVLHPLNITDMTLAAQTPAAEEVHYYSDGADPYLVPIALHDANGGWLATASDLVRFALGVFAAADHAGAPGLLTRATLAQLTQPTAANLHYACGWGVSPNGDFGHHGSFPGTTAVLVHRPDGLAWSLLTNTRLPHTAMEDGLEQLGWNIAHLVHPA